MWSSDIVDRVRLVVWCNFNSAVEQENGLAALIDWGAGANLGPGDRPTVALRWDDGDIQEDVWRLSTDGNATFPPDVDAFISGMKGESRLVARVWRENRTSITAQWEVAGFSDAVRPIEDKCDPNFVPTPTPTATITPTPSNTPTPTPTNTPIPMPTPTATNTPIPTPTPTATPTPTPTKPGVLLRQYTMAGSVLSTHAVVDGIVYVGSREGFLYAVDAASGERLWRYDWVSSSPAVADGTVYFGSTDGSVYAVDTTTGDQTWRYPTGATRVPSSLAVADGAVYFYSTDGYVHAVDADSGDMLQRYAIGDEVSSFLAVADGVVYFDSTDGYVYAVDVDSRELLWRYEKDVQGGFSFLAVADGVVCFGSTDGSVYALDATTGDRLWRTKPVLVPSSLAIVDGVVYYGSTGGYVYAVNPATGDALPTPIALANGYLYAVDATTGGLLWRYQMGLGARVSDERSVVRVSSSPAVADGVVYVGSSDGYLHAVDAASGNLLWRYETEEGLTSSPVVGDGIIYFGSWDGYVYAVDAGGR